MPRKVTRKSVGTAVAAKKKKNATKSKPVKAVNAGVKISSKPLNPSKISVAVASHKKTCAELCGVTNPFCSQAKNAKWPDGLGGQTLTMQIRLHAGVPTWDNGGNVWYVGASLPYSFIGTSAHPGNYTLGTAYSNATTGSNFSTYASQYRIVSGGIIIRNMLPALTAQGFMTVSRLTNMPAPSSSIPGGVVEGSDIQTFPITSGMEIAMAFKPLGMMSRSFQSENTTTTFSGGWDIIKLEIIGGPAGTGVSSIIDVEFVYNIEFTLEIAQTALHALITPTAPHVPKLATASSKLMDLVGHFAYQGVERLGAAFMEKSSEALAALALM